MTTDATSAADAPDADPVTGDEFTALLRLRSAARTERARREQRYALLQRRVLRADVDRTG